MVLRLGHIIWQECLAKLLPVSHHCCIFSLLLLWSWRCQNHIKLSASLPVLKKKIRHFPNTLIWLLNVTLLLLNSLIGKVKIRCMQSSRKYGWCDGYSNGKWNRRDSIEPAYIHFTSMPFEKAETHSTLCYGKIVVNNEPFIPASLSKEDLDRRNSFAVSIVGTRVDHWVTTRPLKGQRLLH